MRRVGERLQRRQDQSLVALACLIAELCLGEPEDVDNVARAALEIDTAACSVFLCGEGCLPAQVLEVVLQIPFVHLSKAPVLKIHDAD